MKKIILVLIIAIAAAVVYYNDNIKTDYKELYRSIDLKVDRCTIDSINNKDIICD